MYVRWGAVAESARHMFKSRTTFVVGAGASQEANLPVGRDLKGRIAEVLDIRFDHWQQTSGDFRIAQSFRDHVKFPDGRSGDINPLLHKCWQIRDVMPMAAISIDNYLDAHRGDEELALCGKLGIVKCILDAEANSNLKLKEHSDRYEMKSVSNTWYLSFLQMLTENVSRHDVDKIFDNIAIVSFNYDRCIEHFLAQAVSEYYNIDISDVRKLVSKLRIYHPYGQVGSLPWQDSDGVRFGNNDRVDLLQIAKQIKTFTEGMHDTEQLEAMRKSVADAETLVFLGFAFHPQNLDLIAPSAYSCTRRVFATAKDVSASDQKAIRRDITTMITRVNNDTDAPPEIEMLDDTCSGFFRHFWRSLPAAL